MITEPTDATGLFTFVCFLIGCALCAQRFGWAVGAIVFFLGFAVVGEMQRLANKSRR